MTNNFEGKFWTLFLIVYLFLVLVFTIDYILKGGLEVWFLKITAEITVEVYLVFVWVCFIIMVILLFKARKQSSKGEIKDVCFLTEHYLDKSYLELAELLGRSVRSIGMKLWRLRKNG